MACSLNWHQICSNFAAINQPKSLGWLTNGVYFSTPILVVNSGLISKPFGPYTFTSHSEPITNFMQDFGRSAGLGLARKKFGAFSFPDIFCIRIGINKYFSKGILFKIVKHLN
ncbi:hypothetical protein BpHYR1_012549 [Brachionus plicatilis]|uniref:Uncharacterized protein n=1 Tax=Brachionus plicatilis TaxID=10195 RepID=A0A3M7PJ56_BRAPC|nr:hypothetical protein BpHYR1_012549 [Brachionus plicatilis]